MRVVFDTNVLFAAFVARTGLCAQILEACLAEHDVFLSQYIVIELARHLQGKANVPENLVQSAINGLVEGASTVEPAQVPGDVTRDPDDLPILGTAVAANADILVTGDKDLLVLEKFRNVEMLAPRAFHDRLLGEPQR